MTDNKFLLHHSLFYLVPVYFIFCDRFSWSLSVFFSKNEDDGVPEWAIVELQGLIQTKNEKSTDAKVVGDLHYSNRNKHPILVLGHHILNGKEQKLEQPMAVIEKVVLEDKTSYIVKAVVKKKLLFKSRPKPIISNVAEKVW